MTSSSGSCALAQITDAKGGVIFEQKDVEVPKDWSMTATNIVASKYLHGTLDTPERETGVRQLVTRVAETIRDWGIKGGYFRTADDAAIFHDELAHLLLQQKAAFNSPVWFNVGCDRIEPNSDARNWHWNAEEQKVEFSPVGYTKPQCSACFINSVNDSLDSILTLAKTEGMLFKWGSGTGTNLSPLRSSTESLSGGGTASGPLSFMKGFDAFAGVIKSGGKTRRAAKMVILNVDHPDIVEFIECKQKEEAKAWALIEHGYDGSGPDSEAYSSIFFQNANNSVRVTDDFMYEVVRDGEFSTKSVKDGRPVHTFKARDLLRKISDATWHCGDPGMQYDTTINRWHTSKNTARINASNPCSEYMFLDDSACNLASLNLLKFAPNGTFDVEAYRHACAVVITAQEILVDNSGYPTEAISRNSHDYRPLGLGYANLGALLMAAGLPYDSDAGRDYAACVTAIMCGEAYLQSSKIAELCQPLAPATATTSQWLSSRAEGEGPALGLSSRAERSGAEGPAFSDNRQPTTDNFPRRRLSRLVRQSRALPRRHPHAPRLRQQHQQGERSRLALRSQQGHLGRSPQARRALRLSQLAGHRARAHRHHRLHDGLRHHRHRARPGAGEVQEAGWRRHDQDREQHRPGRALQAGLHQRPDQRHRQLHRRHRNHRRRARHQGRAPRRLRLLLQAVEGHAHHSLHRTPAHDGRHPALHLRSDLEDHQHARERDRRRNFRGLHPGLEARPEGGRHLSRRIEEGAAAQLHGLGHRQSRKRAIPKHWVPHPCPLQLADRVGTKNPTTSKPLPPTAHRHRLPDERLSITHKFNVGGHEGYLTVGLYKDGMPGEIFITMAKEGSTVSGLMDSFACAVSIGLQHGVPLKLLCEKFAHTRFEPSGWSGNPDIGYAKSIMDYIFRWLQLRFLTGQQQALFDGLRPKYFGAPPVGAPEEGGFGDAHSGLSSPS